MYAGLRQRFKIFLGGESLIIVVQICSVDPSAPWSGKVVMPSRLVVVCLLLFVKVAPLIERK